MRPSPSTTGAAAAAVAAIVLLAGALRWFLDDSPFPAHLFLRHDEEHYVDLVQRFLHGRFTIDYFINPTLYAYVVTVVSALVGGVRVLFGFDDSFARFVASESLEPHAIVLTGRVVSIVASALSVAVVARLGRRLFDLRVGLIAALALATDWIAVSRAPLCGNESLTVLLSLLAIDALVTARERGTRRSLIVCGAWLGLAAATKYSAGILAIPFVLALRGRVILPGLAAGAAFLLGSFSVLLAPRAFWSGLTTQAGFLGGYRTGDELRGERGFTIYLREFPAHHHGLAFALVCAAALLAALVVSLRRRDRDLLLLLACVLPLYLLLGAGVFVSPRFLLPAAPFLFVLAGWLLVRLGDRVARSRPSKLLRALPVVAGAALVLPVAPRSTADLRARHGSAATLGPLCQFVAAALDPADRVVEFAHPARNRLLAEADPWPRIGVAPPPPLELAAVDALLRQRGAPPRSSDLVELLPRCATLAELQVELARLRVTKLVICLPPTLALDPMLVMRTVPNPALRECAYWNELFGWLATLPVRGPERTPDGSIAAAVIELPRR